MNLSNNEIGSSVQGSYLLADAARFVGVHSNSLLNWMGGRGNQSVISVDYGLIDDKYVLSFPDLIEVFVIGKLRGRGISLQSIRKAYQKLSIKLNTKHPFATNQYLTDGKGIWIEVGAEERDSILVNVFNDQVEIDRIIREFIDPIEYELGFSRRWWPMKKDAKVLLDPRRSYGQPIVIEGVQTIALAKLVKAENNNFEAVADWYEVPENSVRDAYNFETNYSHRLAA